MVTQVTGVNSANVAFARNALRYIQGQDIKEKSLFQEIKSSLPSSALFATGFAVVPAASNAIKYGKYAKGAQQKLEIAAGTLKDQALINTIKKGAEENAAKKGVGLIGKIFKKDAETAVADAGKKAVESVSSKAVETGFKGIGKSIKSFALFNLLFQLPEVLSAFSNGGVKEGIKQVGKSAINATGDAVGFAVGSKLGAMAGSSLGIKIGTALGTGVAGPIGTIVGGALGMVLGGVCSTLIGKLTKSIVGKNYSEKKQEQVEEEQAQTIAQDNASMSELQTFVTQKIQEDSADGNISEDTKEMIKELNNIEQNTQLSFSGNNTPNMNTTGDYTTQINQSVRNNMLNQQSQGFYTINAIPKNADGSINHKIYDATPFLKTTTQSYA